MSRFILFLRSLIWTSVLSVLAALVALLLALTNSTDQSDSLTFAGISIALAVLSNSRS